MGMYTDLKVKVKIKPEMTHIIEQLLENQEWENIQSDNAEICMMLDAWCDIGRHNFIPFSPSNQDREWDLNFKDGILTFQCDLKNYEGEIEYFLDNVLRHLIDEIIFIGDQYEEWDYRRTYRLEDGEIVIDDKIVENDYAY